MNPRGFVGAVKFAFAVEVELVPAVFVVDDATEPEGERVVEKAVAIGVAEARSGRRSMGKFEV